LFRVDRVVVELGVFTFPPSDAPTFAQAAALAKKMEPRVNAVLNGEAPNLSQSALRLVIDDSFYAGDHIGFDDYLVNGKTLLRGYGESKDATKIRLQRYGGASNVYSVIQPETNGASWTQYEAGIYVFPSETAASDWQASGYIASYNDESVKVNKKALGLGDASTLYTYAKTASDGSTLYYARAVIISGTTGITIAMITPVRLMADEATQLAQAQFACIQSSDPCAPVPAPRFPDASS
jgi:hypothetical protein